MRTHIAVIGGGIGGLCLAQGLRKAGVDVTVFERDRTPTDRLQGYRIHIDPNGAEALRDCLPPELWEAFTATAGASNHDFGFITEKMKKLLVLKAPKENFDHYSASRITLRQVLLSGLDDVVRYGKTYERYERDDDGTVTLHFADGTTATADVVVAADGGNSRVRKQYLPHAQRVDTGIITIAGKFPLDDTTRRMISPRLVDGPNSVIPPRSVGFFSAPHLATESVGGFGVTEQEGALMDNSGGYILWALGAATNLFPAGIAGLTGKELKDAAAALTEGWHPDLRKLVTMTDQDTVSLLPIRTSVPIDAWQASNITLLGDAIHSMTPMRGIGANTALRDARLLCRALTGGGDVVEAIAAYEEQMRGYGFAAVNDSLKAAEQFVDGNAVARMGFKTFLRVAERFPKLKAKVFS
ncbi:FAD-dependent monooxygenase [Nonomuraea sp. NPDC050556]|uniref:FAD-dependent monooxygenase n=1 Tax=Nonomuraea sp. NPDC050556 TaxID=3364369 RepID=UPI0037A9EFFF